MPSVSMHAAARGGLPVSPAVVLGAGLLTLAVVAHDAYRVYVERVATESTDD